LDVDSLGIARVRNHSKYHKLRAERGLAPNLPNLPNHLKKNTKKYSSQSTIDLTQRWPSAQLLIEKYNRETPDGLAAVEKITPARIKKAKEYLGIFPDEAFWTEVFAEIGRSAFLKGQSNGTGHGAFQANFDWLLTKGKDGTENAVKVFEGRYADGKR
jgi:hypothetical protein